MEDYLVWYLNNEIARRKYEFQGKLQKSNISWRERLKNLFYIQLVDITF